MSLFVLTIPSGGGAFGEKTRSERTMIVDLLTRSGAQVGDGTSTSGNLVDGAGNTVGTWVCVPAATIVT